jgi:hypothetical protein
MMAKKTGSRGLGKLFAEATRDFPMHDRHDMLSEILPQMTPLPRDQLLLLAKMSPTALTAICATSRRTLYLSKVQCHFGLLNIE